MATNGGAGEVRRAALARLEVFSSLTEAERGVVAQQARIRRFVKGRVVVRQGEAADATFGVITGRLRVSLSRANGSEITLAILGPGELCGELGLFQDGSRSARISTLDDASLLVVNKANFLLILESSAAGSLALCRLLAARVRKLARHLDEVTAMPVEQRLARQLLILVDRWGEPAPGGVGISLQLSQQDFADLADTTRQSVNQCLARWRQSGIVTSTPGRVIVSDLRRLRDAASSSSRKY
ncbi:MAG: Crp/Fnr family transcriptional regulator [Myxococcales bacterium]|nr:MAG: Crp/Fnr family transcriptional regulator [Myxococcales bacterium]